MFLLRRCFFAFLLLFTVPLAAASTSHSDWLYQGSDLPKDPAWQLGTLPNGLHYAIRRNALPAGQVSIRIRIDAGSLNEQEKERGWAHFVEHLVFRGTKSFGDREARYSWQQLGASFGSDTNASTGYAQTVYQLDLPKNDRASLDRSLTILAEMMDSARFEPAAVEGERKIVLAEKARRPELNVRLNDITQPLFYAGLKFADRDPIGVDATLNAATPEGLRAFYERWYRPDRATVVIVGDADPAMLTQLLASHFGGWQRSTPAPQEPDYGAIAPRRDNVATLAYPSAPFQAQIVWLRPHRDEPDTLARERVELAERLATQIIDRRLEAKARGEAAFLSAGVGTSRTRHVADVTGFTIVPREDRWREAMNESFAIIADALRAPPSQSEIARELSNLNTALQAAVEGESTVRSPQWAGQLVGAVANRDVPVTAAAALQITNNLAPEMTPTRILAAMKAMFAGTGPRMVLLSPKEIEGGTPAAAQALAAAEKVKPADRQPERTVSFDSLPKLGPPGKEVSRQRIDDMDVTIVRFANGSTLTFKQTDFAKGSVSVLLRFGSGIAGLPADKPSLASWAGIVSRSGFADLDLDGMERLMTGRRMGLNFGVDEDSFVLAGSTDAKEIGDQLRVLALKLAYPRWDAPLFNRAKADRLDSYDLVFSSAASRATREAGALMHPGDLRWQATAKDVIARTGADEVRGYFDPLLRTGPIDAIIVGDVDLDKAVAAFAATVGALPPRPSAASFNEPNLPRPDPKPQLFTHNGDPAQAYAMIGWTTVGRSAPIRERRALALAAAILRTRLFDRMREEAGVTYSPSASNTLSETFRTWGVFVAEAQVRPESADSFFRIAREQVADLAKSPVSAEEFARAQNPVVSSIERDRKNNGYWLGRLADWPSRPELIEQTRTHLSDYKSLTPEAVRAAMAAYVADEGDWSMLVLPEKAPGKASPHGN
jgi:zinc protease